VDRYVSVSIRFSVFVFMLAISAHPLSQRSLECLTDQSQTSTTMLSLSQLAQYDVDWSWTVRAGTVTALRCYRLSIETATGPRPSRSCSSRDSLSCVPHVRFRWKRASLERGVSPWGTVSNVGASTRSCRLLESTWDVCGEPQRGRH